MRDYGLWRTGRHVGRTIYVVSDDDPMGDGVLIGVMDTPELAAEAVQAHNFLRNMELGREV